MAQDNAVQFGIDVGWVVLHGRFPFEVDGRAEARPVEMMVQAAAASFLAFWSACCWCMIQV